jgi:glutamine kinase
MKRVIGKDFFGKLQIDIPTNFKQGDVVEIRKTHPTKISYIGVVGDLFHFGHLNSIQFANNVADYSIVGVFTDEAVEEYRIKPIANFAERNAVIEQLKCVDRTMIQYSRDPTDNLKKIHAEFPDAEIILVHGDNWQDIPGKEFVESIGGCVKKHPYYQNLSTFKIINHFLENKNKYKDIKDFTSYIKGEGVKDGHTTIISSKADTLKALKPLLKQSNVEDFYIFTFSDWINKKEKIVEDIEQKFNDKIVIRSSAINEDTMENSMAGYFDSVLDVQVSSKAEIYDAINTVIDSYNKKDSQSSFNQILVQKQTTNIVMSGVIFTRTLEDNAPYYVINYDDSTGSTDSVTAGRESQMIIFSRFAKNYPHKFEHIINSVKEIESLIPNIPLDIEFALNQQEKVIIFQVRPLAANIHKSKLDGKVNQKIDNLKSKLKLLNEEVKHLVGEFTILADMPDWNPAEIIGNCPNLLDHSLYDYIITNEVWHQARTSQGYYNVYPARLVELFGNKPYVNVRNSFNSFTPAAIAHQLREKLVAFYLDKLRKKPHLQDKVEFDVLFTCYDLNFSTRSQELTKNGFDANEISSLKQALVNMTNTLVTEGKQNIESDLLVVKSMEEFRTKIHQQIKKNHLPSGLCIDYAKLLLKECKEKGTVQFSRLARLGFVAKILLQSLITEKIITQEEFDTFYNSISTVASKISDDFMKLCNKEISKEQFLREYYHLRPGTYDITSMRYEANPDLVDSNVKVNIKMTEMRGFTFEQSKKEQINTILKEHGLNFNIDVLLQFVKMATEARELAKFEFTKNLSDAMELIAQAGKEMGFTRKEIAMLDINDIFQINQHADSLQTTTLWKGLIKQQEQEKLVNNQLQLPSIILNENDFDIIQHYSAKPNFITQKSIQAKVININQTHTTDEIEGKIVILENGDPGYDWIFTRNPSGLITKYGGVASHMSIRCAEFGIPAAIGCGELIFNKVKNAPEVHLDCKGQKIIPQ